MFGNNVQILKMTASTFTLTFTVDLTWYEENVIKRKLTEDELIILKEEIGNHFDLYMDEAMYENSGVVTLMKIWGRIYEELSRPLAKNEMMMVMDEYYGGRYDSMRNFDDTPMMQMVRSWK